MAPGWSAPDAAAIAVGPLCQRTVEGQLDSVTTLARRPGRLTVRGTVPAVQEAVRSRDPERAASPSIRSAGQRG